MFKEGDDSEWITFGSLPNYVGAFQRVPFLYYIAYRNFVFVAIRAFNPGNLDLENFESLNDYLPFSRLDTDVFSE